MMFPYCLSVIRKWRNSDLSIRVVGNKELIGRLLIKYLIQQVRKKGVHKIVLWVIKDNVKARKFYEVKGFVNSGKHT